MEIEALKQLVHHAKQDKHFYQRLLSDPKKAMESAEFVKSARKAMKSAGRGNKAFAKRQCGETCGPASCSIRTCGSRSCGNTCSVSCGISCGNSCRAVTCKKNSCARTIGLIANHVSAKKR